MMSDFQNLNVVILDDDSLSIFLTEEVLKDHFGELSIHSFTDPDDCLKFLTCSKDKSLILLDINMPVMNGWSFVEKYKQLNLIHQIVLLTSSINEDDRNKAAALGVGFMTKPLQPEELEDFIEPQIP